MPEPTPAYPFQTDWNRIAKLIVHDSLKTEPGERVLLHVDPNYFPELTEQVRMEILRAGAVEVASVLRDSPGLHALRKKLRRREEPAMKEMEDKAVRSLFDASDIYIWLPTSWNMAWYQTEEILTSWQGRSVHFHWITDVVDPHVFQKFSEAYVRALFIDYEALDARQMRMIGMLRGAEVRITCPRGSDLKVQVSDKARFHRGNGNASRAFIAENARPGSARDREVELPCGLVRTIDISEPEGTLVVANQEYRGRFMGTMRYTFRGGRLVELGAERNEAWLRKMWETEETGAKDQAAELNIGTNPELRPIPGIDDFPYYGYGAGIVRFDIGMNWESGGPLASSFHRWLAFADATLTANGRKLVDRGELVA